MVNVKFKKWLAACIVSMGIVCSAGVTAFAYTGEREAEKQGKIPQETLQEPRISFYAAECMEFPSMGEYYENLTLEEAVEKYKTIPADRIHGIKGIGFCLKDGSIYDGEYE